MDEGGLRAGEGNSGEGFRPLGGGLRRAKAWTIFSRARGTPGAGARALDRGNLAGHRAGAADHHGQPPTKLKLANSEAQLGKPSMGTGASPRGGARGGLARLPADGRLARRARVSGEVERRGQSAREGKDVRNGMGKRVRVRAVLKKELGCVGGQRCRGSRRACASARVLVHSGRREGGADRAVP
jgi:hypothetical protein